MDVFRSGKYDVPGGTAAAMGSEVQNLQSRMADAPTRDEALKLAITAAELCMRALKIATDSSQRSDFSSRCQSLLDEAEQIKANHDWRPSRSPSGSDDLRGRSTTPRSSLSSPQISQIKRLAEPTSARELSKAEQLLILRASKLNGSVFPPWKGPPNGEEFILKGGEGPYLDESQIALSHHQLEFLDGWKRAKDALPPPTWYPGERKHLGPSMQSTRKIDLVQDAASDCSVVASLCAGTARAERGHAKILSSVIYPYDLENMRPVISPNGKYIVRLNFNGCYRKVVIDDRLPVSKTARTLHVVDRNNHALLWPALVEKAYLKVRGGYNFPGSNSATDLWILTGWIPEQVLLQNDDTVPTQLWKRVSNALRYGDVLVTMGTGQMSHRTERELGLAGQHNYAVLDMKEEDEQKLLLLKNPWIEGKSWRGRLPQSITNGGSRSSGATTINSDVLAPNASSPGNLPPHPLLSPGTFWIDFNNLLQNFESMYLNWNPGLFTYREDIHFSWDLSERSKRSPAGSIVNHPQFALTCQVGGVVWLLLCRHFKNCVANINDLVHEPLEKHEESLGYISLYAYEKGGKRVHTGENPLEKGPYVDSPQTLLRLDLAPESTYTIVASEQQLPSSLHSFTLSTFSNSPIAITHAVHKYSFGSNVTSAWTAENAGGNGSTPTYAKNPQFSLKVPARASIAVLLESPSDNVNLNVKLLHGRGQRMDMISRRDIIADSGDYRRSSALAELEALESGSYTIICSTFEAGQYADFTLRVDSTVQAELKRLPNEGAGRLPMKLANACFGASKTKLAAPIIPRRMVRLKAVARFLRAYNPIGGPHNFRSQSPLRVTIELGRGPSRRILIASSEGEYSDAATIRTEDVDLVPEMLLRADMWLVLDRLSGPAVGGEEVFGVELFCDGVAEQAVSVGVWRGWSD